MKPDFRAIPPAPAGLRVGLFGGSFDPAHAGHAHVARTAMKRLALDRVWWLVTPQNPLKPNAASPLAERMASARREARGARMVVSDLETRLGLRFTADTLEHLRRRRPGAAFVWLMGADAMAGFHRWRRWRAVFAAAPIVILPRPGAGLRALAAPAFARMRSHRRAAAPGAAPPVWMVLQARLRPESSTALRAGRGGGRMAQPPR